MRDVLEKTLESYNDVFADIVNVLLFNGKQLLKEGELQEYKARNIYPAKDKIREIERDVVKQWSGQNIRISYIGLENQTKQDKDMPLRVIGYDGADYRSQLSVDDSEGAVRYPVVTLVLYFGYNKRWDVPKSLFERIRVSDELKPYVNDYKINVFDIAFLTDEQVNMFKSDFKIIADYFCQKRKNKDYQPTPEKMKHVYETLHLLDTLAGEHRFTEVYYKDDKDGEVNMCDMLDRIEAKGEAKAEAKMTDVLSWLRDNDRLEDIDDIISKVPGRYKELLAEYEEYIEAIDNGMQPNSKNITPPDFWEE